MNGFMVFCRGRSVVVTQSLTVSAMVLGPIPIDGMNFKRSNNETIRAIKFRHFKRLMSRELGDA